MDNNWIFECGTYREVVAKKLKSDGNERGYRSKLAQSAGCQLSYINHVLDTQADFTPDQAAGICEFWGFGDLETEYFMNLIHLGRARSPRLQQRIERRLVDIRSEHLKSKKSRLSHEPYDRERVIEYYLDWAASAVHAFLGVAGTNEPPEIANRLRMDESRVRHLLSLLQDLGFATKEGTAWRSTSKFFHAADESRFANLHHMNWRRQVERELERYPQKKGNLHYTALYSLSQPDVEKLRKFLVETISQTREVVRPSPEETVACFTLDLFEL